MTAIITTSSDIAAAIRARRRAVGMTQRQLANAADCSLTWLANIEAGCIPHQSAALSNIRAALTAAEQAENDNDRGANPAVVTTEDIYGVRRPD